MVLGGERDSVLVIILLRSDGPRPAVRANITFASGILLVVPDARTPDKFTALTAVIQSGRSLWVPLFACDANANTADAARWACAVLETFGSTRILVTGPRATGWPEGEGVARRFVLGIAVARQSPI